MRVTEDVISGVPLIGVTGDLDHAAKKSVLELLDRIFRAPAPPKHFLLDLTECAFVDSGGISVLLNLLDRLPTQGWLGLISVASGPGRALMYTGFLDLDRVRFFSSVDEAANTVSAEKCLAKAQERVDRTAAARAAAAGGGGLDDGARR